MNRIEQLFKNKKENILSIYFTAGFPKLKDTTTLLNLLQQEGADIVEIGIPFSDPMADGPVIQHSNEIALENGMSIPLLFEQLKDIRATIHIPLVLMGYLNPILQYGIEAFLKKASELGIDGLIIPDLPLDDYLEEYKLLFEKYAIKNVFLVTPQTSEARIRKIDDCTDSFIYLVSSYSITGAKNEFSPYQLTYFERIKGMKLKNPGLIGFGISSYQTFSTACKYNSGAIIGSAFIRMIESSKNYEHDISQFINSIKADVK
jgi:tryptophan synthase alpha chain